MARGWESKSVEAQMEEAASRLPPKGRARLSPEELDLLDQRQQIESSLVRVRNDFAAAKHPRYREQLTAAIAFLEQKLAKLAARAGA